MWWEITEVVCVIVGKLKCNFLTDWPPPQVGTAEEEGGESDEQNSWAEMISIVSTNYWWIGYVSNYVDDTTVLTHPPWMPTIIPLPNLPILPWIYSLGIRVDNDLNLSQVEANGIQVLQERGSWSLSDI